MRQPTKTARWIALASAISAAIAPRAAMADVPPTGYLDAASCDAIAGWSQDPDEPAKAIDVHIYFGGPAGTPGAPAVATTANIHREDLCAAIGSCEHGFSILSPLSLHDGQARGVYAYGIDSQGGANPLLGSSPLTMTCPPAPPAPPAVRRKIDGVKSYDAWRFVSFWDLLPLSGTDADTLADGPDLPAAPRLIKADDGAPEIWLVDGGVRRPVPGGAVATWRLDLGAIEVRPAAEVKALVEGTPLRPRPVLFIRGGLYVADDAQPPGQDAASSSSSSSTAAGAGGSGGAGGAGADPPTPSGRAEGSCALKAPHDPSTNTLISAFFAALALARHARRRARRLSARPRTHTH
jgi:hypothetical protein